MTTVTCECIAALIGAQAACLPRFFRACVDRISFASACTMYHMFLVHYFLRVLGDLLVFIPIKPD